jgi:hypothetical protein
MCHLHPYHFSITKFLNEIIKSYIIFSVFLLKFKKNQTIKLNMY